MATSLRGQAGRSCRAGGSPHAQIAGALQALRDGLTRLDVAVVGLEAKEEAPIEVPASLEYRD